MAQGPQFAPNTPQQPFAPSGQGEAIPQQANIPSGKEGESTWSKSVSRSATIRKATQVVITTREELAAYLIKGRLKLLTSSVEFQQTGDFIASSYVMYLDHNNTTEPMSAFIERYPDLQPIVQAISDKLRPIQGQMQIKTGR